MAESDLDIRIRLQNEASGEIDAIKKEVEDAADAVAKLSEAPSEEMSKFLEDLATKIKEFASQADATGESFAGFLEGISSAINNAAEQLKDAFPDDSEFLGGIVDALTEVVEGLDGTKDGSDQAAVGIGDLGDQFVIAGQKAQKANDQFTQASAAANPTAAELATAGTLGAHFVGPQTSGPTLAEFALLQEAVKQTGVEFDVTGAKKDSFRGNLTGLSGDLRKADAAAAEFNRALIASQEAINAKKLQEFQQAAFGVDKTLAQGIAELERYSSAFNHLMSSLNPAVAAQIRLAEATKILDFALKEGWIAVEQYNAALKQLELNASQAGKATTGLAGFLNGLKTAILGTALGFTAAQVAIQLFQKATEAITQGFTDAAQTQQLNTALKALAASTNVTTESINQAVTGLEKMGFAGSAAREAVTRLIQSELSVADAIKLGAAARNQAIVTGQKEAQVLETLINGIANRNSRALRSIRLTIDQAEAEDKYARSIEKHSDQLTRAERQAATMAAALEQVNKASSAAAEGFNDVNVVMNKFSVTFAEVAEKGAEPFLPVITALARLGTSLVELVEVVGKIAGSGLGLKIAAAVLNLLNAGVVLLTKYITEAGDAMTEFGINADEAMSNLLRDLPIVGRFFAKTTEEIKKQREELQKLKDTRAEKGNIPTTPSIPPLPKAQDVQKSLDALIGPQVTKGFHDLSKEGKEALDDLTRVIGDFGTAVEDGGTGVITTLEEVDRALLNAFSKAKTPGDILNFLDKMRESAHALGIDLSNIEREAAFRRQKALLDEMQASMSGYLAISKELLGIQQSYNKLLADGVQHELAMQQIAAEVVNDKTKVVALQFRANAEQLSAAQENFKLEQAAIRRDTEKQQEEKRIESARRGDVRDLADFIVSSDRDMNQKLRKSSEDYYGTLKGLQTAAREGWKASALEVKNLREAQETARQSARTSIRELEKQLQGPAFSLRDTLDEISEKQSAAAVAISKNNFARAKENLDRTKTLAQQLAQIPGFNRRAQDELEATAQLEDESFEKQLKIAALKEETDKVVLKNATEAVEAANKLMVTLGKKIEISFDDNHMKVEIERFHKATQGMFDKNPIKVTLVGADGKPVSLPGVTPGGAPLTAAAPAAQSQSSADAVFLADLEKAGGNAARQLEIVNKDILRIRALLEEKVSSNLFGDFHNFLNKDDFDKYREALRKLEVEKTTLERILKAPMAGPQMPDLTATAKNFGLDMKVATQEGVKAGGTEGVKAIDFTGMDPALQARIKAKLAALEVPVPDTKKLETGVATATSTGAVKGLEDAQKWQTAPLLKWENIIDPKTGQMIQKAVSDATAGGISTGIEKIVDPTTKLVTYRQAVATATADGTAEGAKNPIDIKFNSQPAAEDLAKQVQSVLDRTPFLITARLKEESLRTGESLTTLSRAQGGIISGQSPNSTADNLLGWLTAGEYVQPVAAVRHYGTAFMESIRKMQFPRFAEGGMVGATSVHAVSSAEKETTLHLTFQGKSLGRVRGPSDTVRDITSALKELSRGVA